MANVTYDDRSLIVDGKRVWLVSGSIHYFRVPAELWADRLLKAKRAGLNCISTYIAWNFHEPSEGQWELTGDRDVGEFIRLAGELGLYVILRPGPYICAEWDFGGLPAWLGSKTGIAYRTNNASYTHYYDKYFRQVLPRLAEMQVTRGGNIILIQNENEYVMTTTPDRLNYLQFITKLFRRSGFDIPIINCNLFSDPPVPETIECVNTWGSEVQLLKKMRVRQADAPLLVTEFYPGWFDDWGGEHRARDARAVARRAMEILGCGAQYNYYVFHGGTNFGFWGSRLGVSDCSYQTTSYDYDAPVAEGGGLTRKYYLTRLVNMFANHMGESLAHSRMDSPGVSLHDSTAVLNVSGPRGRWAIVTNNGKDEIATSRVSLPDGRELVVSIEAIGATAVPVDVRLDNDNTLNYANLMPLGFFSQFARKALVLHGPPGWEGNIGINGQHINVQVPEGDQPKLIEHHDLLLVVVNTDLATRTWQVEDKLIFGPKFVGEDTEEVICSRGTKQYAWLSLEEGQLRHKKLKPAPARKHTPPQLGSWQRISVCTEPVAKHLKWQRIPGPRDVDQLGLHYGYVWYRMEIEEQRGRKRYIFLPGCEDRASVYLNGELLGVWGRGSGAVRSPISGQFKRGKNVLTMLVDNLGRQNFGAGLGEKKGLFGHVYDAKPLRITKFKLKQGSGFPKRIIPRQMQHLIGVLEEMPLWTAEVQIVLRKVTPVHLSFTNVPHNVAVLCNDRAVGLFTSAQSNYGDVTFGPELVKGKNVIKLLLWGDVAAKTLDNVKFHTLEESLSQGASWSYRPWTLPTPGGLIVGKDRPAWYVTKFKYTPAQEPLFVHLVGAKKGQIFLNGHNVGRYWNIGPQQYYYLPECWLKDVNELLIFDEQGSIPARSRLAFRPLGPYGE